MKDPVKVGLPTHNNILVVPRVNKSRDSVPPVLLGDLPLYSRDSPAIENTVSERTRTPPVQLTPSIDLSHRTQID